MPNAPRVAERGGGRLVSYRRFKLGAISVKLGGRQTDDAQRAPLDVVDSAAAW